MASSLNRYECVTTREQLDYWVDLCEESRIVAVDTETTGTNSLKDTIVGVCLAAPVEQGKIDACYIPLDHNTKERQLDGEEVLDALQPFLRDDGVSKVFHNAYFDLVLLDTYGVEVSNVHDTMLMSYALTCKQNHNNHNMDDVAMRRLKHRTTVFGEVVSNVHEMLGVNDFRDVPLDAATFYAAEDTEVTLKLFYDLRLALKKKQHWDIYNEIDRPHLPAVVAMKTNGLAISKKHLAKIGKDFTQRLAKLEATIREAEPNLNFTSTQALGNWMYSPHEDGGLGLPIIAVTKTGKPKADAETLEQFEGVSPALDTILEYRQLDKLMGTYVLPISQKIDEETGRLHPDINTCVTATARMSGSNPNTQNIPTTTEDGAKLRKAFVARKGRKMVGSDWSNIEMRVLAHVSQEPKLIDLFKNGGDQHAETAFDVFGVKPGDPEFKEMRGRSKTLNFATVYGITPIGLAAKFKVSVPEAEDILDRFLDSRPMMKEWIEQQKHEARKGHVYTLFGRRLYIGHGYGAERQAVNYVIQGTATGDMTRLAAGQLYKKLPKGADLLLEIHDEFLVECWDGQEEEVAAIMKETMETCADDWIEWRVPIIAEPKIGMDWGEVH